jgi:XTP/dITP diphosphohydrolase
MSTPLTKKILIATSNRGKAVEIASILEGCADEFLSLDSLPEIGEPVEDGDTFADNALIKARYYANFTDMPVVADDSGLMVDILGGQPGVHSARLVGPGEPDSARNEKLLAMLRDYREPAERGAQFVCAACFIDTSKDVAIIEEGVLRGTIAFEPDGEEGFGFDPVFIPDGFDRTIAYLGLEIKNKISHRVMAFRGLAERIAVLHR